jgi:hypothetical protein
VLDPSLLHAFSRVERIALAGRPGRAAFEAEAVWRENIDLISVDWPYATSIQFVVDGVCGVLLDLQFKLDGEPFISWTVEDIAFDEIFPEGTFEP